MPAGLLQGAFSEEDYGRRRMKLITEKDSLIVPDDARTLELGRQLEKIGDYWELNTSSDLKLR